MTARIAGYVSRKEWGALPPKYVTPLNDRRMEGTAVHHGGAGGYSDHSRCAGQWRGYQVMHLRGDRGFQSDIAYNMGVCRHGYVFEGRTFENQGGANGTKEANRAYFSVCVLGDGDVAFSEAVTDALEWVIHQARTKHNAGMRVRRHRDFFTTGCPGAKLSAWTPTVDNRPISTVSGTGPLRKGDRGEHVTTVQRLLTDLGYDLGDSGCDGSFGDATDAAVRAFQTNNGLDVDGVVGPATLSALSSKEAIMAQLNPETLEAIRKVIRQELDDERTARSVLTRHQIMLDPRDPFGPRRSPSNVIEHAAGILHDDKGLPIKGDDGGFVKPTGYVSGVRYVEDVDQMTGNQEA